MRTIHIFNPSDGRYLRTVTANDPVLNNKGEIVFGKLSHDMTEVPLPEIPDGYYATFDGTQWNLNQIPIPEPTPEPTAEELEMEALRQELDERERYLSETDYKIIKCVEQGLDLEAEYPGLKALRQSARDRINEIRDTLGTTE